MKLDTEVMVEETIAVVTTVEAITVAETMAVEVAVDLVEVLHPQLESSYCSSFW